MTGTRHERVALVTLAYVVGFTSAFIAFGVSNINEARVVYQNVDLVESEIDTEYSVDNTMGSVMGATAVLAQYEGGMLTATVGEQRYVLSIDEEIIPAEERVAFAEQGLHVVPPPYVVSPSGKFIYFCEQSGEGTGECQAFVFDVESNVINFVTAAGEKLSVTNELAAAAVWQGDVLNLGGEVSLDTTTPWRF